MYMVCIYDYMYMVCIYDYMYLACIKDYGNIALWIGPIYLSHKNKGFYQIVLLRFNFP